MGNTCGAQQMCGEGQNEKESAYNSRPQNQEQEKNNAPQDDQLLMQYSSNDKQKIVRIQSHLRGHQTRQRLENGNDAVHEQMQGDLKNVHNLRLDQSSEESAIYSGQMLKDHQNIKQGYGIMRWPDGTVYEGLWENNLYNGRGKLYHASGDLYEGEFVDDMAQGFGIYKHANGSKYVGYWNQDKQHGFGKEKWNDMSMYQGFYQNASKEGQGEYCWPDGNRYVGEWSQNMLNGQGLFIWHDDRLYLGDWKDNMMHGQGVYKWGDGRIFMGAYLDDRKSGMGCYLWADGRAYHGEWLAGKQHGSGFYIVPDTNSSSLKIKQGYWINGKRQEWKDECTEEEKQTQIKKYQAIQEKQTQIQQDIEQIEKVMKILVQQQLGDKNNYDSSLHGLGDSNMDMGNNNQKNVEEYEPLENLIREALNYDSNLYQAALGIDMNSKEPNGVIKSQEFAKLKKLQQTQ